MRSERGRASGELASRERGKGDGNRERADRARRSSPRDRCVRGGGGGDDDLVRIMCNDAVWPVGV